MQREWQHDCRELLQQEPTAGETVAEERFNLVVPRSRCPHCQHKITAWENIPLVSYALQRGKCRACAGKISWRYPAIEFLSGLLGMIVIWQLGLGAVGISALLLTWALIALSFIDIDHHLLPDSIVLPGLWAGLLLNGFGLGLASLEDAVMGTVAAYLFLWMIYWLFKLLTGKEGMGYGDFKLYALFGAWLGWQQLPMIILLASAVGAVLGISIIIARKQSRQQPLPFGPYLAIAGWIALLWGEALLDSYLRLAHIPH